MKMARNNYKYKLSTVLEIVYNTSCTIDLSWTNAYKGEKDLSE